jgi:c-di-GMP-binding flagellar brake protein YcgR
MAYFNTQVKANESLKIGKPIIMDVSDPLLEGVYKSSIYDIDFVKRVLKIGMPSAQGQFIPIPAGTRLYVKMVDRNSMYVFQSMVVSYEKDEEGFLVMYIIFPETLRKIQRRQFVRIPFFKEGSLIRLTNNEIVKYISKDLSAGGLLIVTPLQMTISEKVIINFAICDSISLENVTAQIARMDTGTQTKHWIYGVEFKDLPRSIEDRIVRYVFVLEQESRKKLKEEGESP